MLVVFIVSSTARSFRDRTPHLLSLAKDVKLSFNTAPTPPPGIEPRTVAWQSITLPPRHASSSIRRSTNRKIGGEYLLKKNLDKDSPAGTIRWINVEMRFRTTSQRYFNYISTLFHCQMPAGSDPF